MSKFVFPIVTVVLLGCAKSQTGAETPEQLPPETQAGARTFGCLVNGKVYQPNGSDGSGVPNLRAVYEVFNGRPYLKIRTLRFSNTGTYEGEMYFSIDSCFGVGSYPLRGNKNRIVYGGNFFNGCGISGFDTTTWQSGTCTITRLDPTAGIFSGTFQCTIKPDNCDTMRITEGRFDLKL